MAHKTPLAFLSYANNDDEHEQGKLREFAMRLSGEVRLYSGEDFPIFVDREHLNWGHEWEARIEKSLDGATFLIPILTPGYFKSEYCLLGQNKRGAWNIAKDCEANVKRSGNVEE